MTSKRAFTFIELLVVCCIIALLIGILLPALEASQCLARSWQKSIQIRGIHVGLILFSQGNNTYFPGMDKKGNRLKDYSTEFRFQELLEDNYFTGEYAISPSETKTIWKEGKVTSDMYSYAMLNLSDVNSPRNDEWKDTANDQAVMVTDRGIANGTGIKSVHTNPSKINVDDWQGDVAWNDNHVTTKSSHKLPTQYGKAEANKNDHLFDKKNASLVYSGIDLLIEPEKQK